jgi:hypothetical protein
MRDLSFDHFASVPPLSLKCVTCRSAIGLDREELTVRADRSLEHEQPVLAPVRCLGWRGRRDGRQRSKRSDS